MNYNFKDESGVVLNSFNRKLLSTGKVGYYICPWWLTNDEQESSYSFTEGNGEGEEVESVVIGGRVTSHKLIFVEGGINSSAYVDVQFTEDTDISVVVYKRTYNNCTAQEITNEPTKGIFIDCTFINCTGLETLNIVGDHTIKLTNKNS